MKKFSLVASNILLATAGYVSLASAQGTAPGINQTGANVNNIFNIIKNLANQSIGILVTIALAVFFWGLVKYLFKLGSDEGAKGKDLMIYGIVALFIMVAVWGLVQFIGNFFGIAPGQGVGSVQNLVPYPTQ